MAITSNEIDKLIGTVPIRVINVDIPPNVTIPSANITAGIGKNVLSNSGFYLGLDGWAYNQTWGLNYTGYSISSTGTQQNTAWVSSTATVYLYKHQERTPVTPGETLELSAYIGTIGCQTQLYCEFYNSSNILIGQGTVIRHDRMNNNEKRGGARLSDFKRCYQFVTVPDNSATVAFGIQKKSSATLSYAFVCLPFLAVVSPGQTELSKWNEGTSGQTSAITPSNYKDYIENGAISAMARVFSAADATTTKTVNLSFNSNGANVLIHFSIQLTSTVNASTVGACKVNAVIKMDGAQIESVDMGQFINSTGSTATIVTLSSTYYYAAPPVETVTYSASFLPTFTGNGTGGKIANAKMEIIGLKR